MYLFDTIANVLHNVRTLGLDEADDRLADADVGDAERETVSRDTSNECMR